MALQFKTATRKRAPMLIAIAGPSGSGKTYSALLLAAGLAGNGRVGFIDTENGRGSMYADSPGIMAALPNGYDIGEISAPFSPDAYIEAIKASEAAGHKVCVIDSATHEWEGIGGCCDIAETKKLRGMPNWALAKKDHKRFMNHCLTTNMDLIFCLRAREKVKIEKVNGRDEVIPIGMMPICEKNFVFEQLISLMIDEKSHEAHPIKVPEKLAAVFSKPHLITKADGEFIQKWNQGGIALADDEQLQKRARAAAEDGMKSYEAFFKGLSKSDQKTLHSTSHDDNKHIAQQYDDEQLADANLEAQIA